MKKKMTVLAVLFLSVAISAYSVAGTYAKYTSNTTITDSARVAKWGVGFTDSDDNMNTVDLFAASYLSTDSTTTDVLSTNGTDKVVAPGTSGSYTFQLTGAPETNFILTYDASESTIGAGLANELFFWIDDEDEADAYNFATLKTHLAALSNATTNAVYKSGNIEATGSVQTHTINWKWVMEDSTTNNTGDEDATAAEKLAANDALDTALGNAATPETVNLVVKVTATQTEAPATLKANGTELD